MRLGAFAVVVPDYDAGLAFFRDGLGWEVTADEDQGRKRWITLRCGVVEEVPRHEAYGTVAVWHDPWGGRWDLIGPPASE